MKNIFVSKTNPINVTDFLARTFCWKTRGKITKTKYHFSVQRKYITKLKLFPKDKINTISK